MENPTVVDRDDLGARVLEVPGETASHDPARIHQQRGSRLGGRAHRLTLLADQSVIGRQGHLMCRAHARRHLVDLDETDLRRLVGMRCSATRRQGERPSGTEQRSREPHSASSSARSRGTDVFSGRMPTLSA